jgi:multiple sugar transport system permease protein
VANTPRQYFSRTFSLSPKKESFVMRDSFLASLGRNFLLVFWALFALFPLLWMILLSFKSDAQMFNTTFFFTPTLDNYQFVLMHTNYLRCFFDNLIISGGAVILSVLVGVPAAYALARFQFRGKEDLAFTILSFKFAPEMLVVLPLLIIYHNIGLYDSYIGLIWVYQLITMPLLVWVLRGYFEDIPIEVEQAAQLDGYKWYHIFWSILLPLIRPGLVAAALLSFIFAWNSFTFPLLLSGIKIIPVTVEALRYIGTDTVRYGQMAVAATVTALPEVILALLIQKHLVRGLSFGAVKG